MFRISDVFKRHKQEKNTSAPIHIPPPKPDVKEKGPQRYSISSVVGQESEKTNLAYIAEFYGKLLDQAKKIYRPDAVPGSNLLSSLRTLQENAVGLLTQNNKELLRLCLSDYPRFDDYLYYHAVNVSVISIIIGLELGYERPNLTELGVASFLHDIGLTRYLETLNKTDMLEAEEHDQTIRQHPEAGAEILSNINKEAVPQAIMEVVLQEHERLDGSGYPKGLKEGEISEYAQIVGVADVYELMLHRGLSRNRYTPLETINKILGSKDKFSGKIIKALINRIGVFPLGTIVQLNTKESGVVVNNNPESPLRPVVSILFDAHGKELKEQKQIDLAGNPVVYIEECLADFTAIPPDRAAGQS